MDVRRGLIVLGAALVAPMLCACPRAAPAQSAVDLAGPGMVAARKGFECAAPVDVGALSATRRKNGKQWYATPPGFTVFGFPVVDLGVGEPPADHAHTFASVRASPQAVLASVRQAIPDARFTSPGYDQDHTPANLGYYYVTWGDPAAGAAAPSMTLEGEGPETYVICRLNG